MVTLLPEQWGSDDAKFLTEKRVVVRGPQVLGRLWGPSTHTWSGHTGMRLLAA